MKNIFSYYQLAINKNILNKYEEAIKLLEVIKNNINNIKPIKLELYRFRAFYEKFELKENINDENKKIDAYIIEYKYIKDYFRNIEIIFFRDEDLIKYLKDYKRKTKAVFIDWTQYHSIWKFSLRPKYQDIVITIDSKDKNIKKALYKEIKNNETSILHELIHYVQYNKNFINFLRSHKDYYKDSMEHEAFINVFFHKILIEMKNKDYFKDSYLNVDKEEVKKHMFKLINILFPERVENFSKKQINIILEAIYNKIQEKFKDNKNV